MAQIDLLTHLRDATLVVQLEYVLLLGMSLASWAVICWKILQYKKAQRHIRRDVAIFQDASRLPEAVRQVAENMGQEGANAPSVVLIREAVHEYKQLEKLDATPGEMARIILENVRHGLHEARAAQASKLSTSLSFLAMCANAAPLLGLFGTVWGIFHAFQGFSDVTPGSLMVVGRGLAEALGTTIAGMLVAIPAAIAHNMLYGWLDRLHDDLATVGSRFLFLLRKELGLPPAAAAQDESETASLPNHAMPPSRNRGVPHFRLPGLPRPAKKDSPLETPE